MTRAPSTPSEILALYDQALLAAGELGIRPWLVYACGAVPFYTALLIFWNDVTSGAGDPAAFIRYAPLLTLLYLWLQWARLLFTRSLSTYLTGERASPWTSENVLHSLGALAWHGAAKLAILPLALLSVVPLASAVAFFRTAPLYTRPPGISNSAQARQSRSSYAANWMSLAGSAILTAIIFLNVAPALALLPQLARIFTGHEGTFSRSGMAFVANPAFFATAALVSWALADPLVTAHYTLRALLHDTRPSGGDLLLRLKRLTTTVALAIAIAAGAHAQPPNKPPVPVPALEGAIGRALASPEYDWRLERPAQETAIDKLFKAAGETLDRFVRWLLALFPDSRPPAEQPPRQTSGMPARQMAYAGLALAALFAIFVIIARVRRRKPSSNASQATATSDGEFREVTSVASSEWLRLAEEAARREDFRGALRAVYLGSLASLAAAGLVSIARGKTNSDFERELRRRARQPALSTAFSAAVRKFDRCWYGDHPAGAEEFRAIREDYSRISAHLVSAGDSA